MRAVRGDRGQATVEFALILPLLLIITVVLVHIGVGLAVQVQLEAAAREGARAAAVEPASAGVRQRTPPAERSGAALPTSRPPSKPNGWSSKSKPRSR